MIQDGIILLVMGLIYKALGWNFDPVCVGIGWIVGGALWGFIRIVASTQ